jgi:hypothetical protein
VFGLVVIVASNLFLPGGLEKWGEALTVALIAARAKQLQFVRQLESRYSKLPEQRLPQEGQHKDSSLTGGFLMVLGAVAAFWILWFVFYRTPPLVGFEVDNSSAGFAAFLITGLITVELAAGEVELVTDEDDDE